MGWLGFLMAVFSCILGVASLVYWYQRPHHTAYGIAAVFIGSVAAGLGLAYQVKHAAGTLDSVLFSLPTPLAYYALFIATVLLTAG